MLRDLTALHSCDTARTTSIVTTEGGESEVAVRSARVPIIHVVMKVLPELVSETSGCNAGVAPDTFGQVRVERPGEGGPPWRILIQKSLPMGKAMSESRFQAFFHRYTADDVCQPLQ